MNLVWKKKLDFLVNSVAISNDGAVVAAGTYYFPYPNHQGANVTDGTFATHVFDAKGTLLFTDPHTGNEGVYSVAVSGDGKVIAAGGLFSGGMAPSDPTTPSKGLVRAYNVDSTRVVDFTGVNTRVNSVSLSSDGTVLAAVTLAGELLLWVNAGGGFPANPIVVVPPGGPRLDMVCVHPSGQWLVACGRKRTVHFVDVTAAGGPKLTTWNPPPPRRLLACAIAATADTFVVGGENRIYVFTKASMTAPGGAQPIAQRAVPEGGTKDDLRWLAVSPDGKLITVVANLGNDIGGYLLTLSHNNGQLQEVRRPQVLWHNPNSTSMDAAGKFITVADGHPIATPGTFYLFEAATGKKVMEFETPDDMNWPMVISADGAAAVGGSDNSHVYYFA
jgi:WD40 repeat protein